MEYAEYINIMNGTLEERARENNHARSYVRVVRPHNPKKVNIVGSFAKAIELEAGGQMNFTKDSRMSFGMVPEETFQKYRQMIFGEQSPFGNPEAFQTYVDENYRNFCVDIDEFTAYFERARERAAEKLKGNEDSWLAENVNKFENKDIQIVLIAFQKALYARCILQAARVGSFKFGTSKVKNLVPEIVNILNQDKTCACTDDKDILTLSGRAMDETLQKLDGLVSFRADETGIEFTPKNEEQSCSITRLYSNDYESYYRFLGSAIYSGVIPRLCGIEYSAPKMSNMDMQELRLILGRTSYLTMYALNKPNILMHPFLELCKASDLDMTLKELNTGFDLLEIEAQKEFRNSLGDNQEDFERLNTYLRHSWNVHNVNVSGNLITSDNYCIYTRRGSNVVDAGNYYCSVNGGSEIFDSQVEFYQSSVVEDLPTIHYSKEPVYFGGELTREAIGELGIIDSSTFWNYYGISILGKSDLSGEKEENGETVVENAVTQVIWFHFNVLAERQCLDTFDQIVENKKLATENFESSKIFGYKLLTYESAVEMLASRFFSFLDVILNNTDLIAMGGLVLALLLGQEQLSIGSQVTMFLGVVAVVSVVYKLYCNWKESRQKKKVVSYQNKNRIRIEKRLNDRRLGNPKRKDPIFMALTALRFERIFHE